MGVVESICHEVADLKLKGHYPETRRDGRYIRIMELLERPGHHHRDSRRDESREPEAVRYRDLYQPQVFLLVENRAAARGGAGLTLKNEYPDADLAVLGDPLALKIF